MLTDMPLRLRIARLRLRAVPFLFSCLAASLACGTAASPALGQPVAPVAPVAAASAPAWPAPVLPTWRSADEARASCDAALDGAHARVERLARSAPGADWLRGWEDLNDWEEDAGAPLTFMREVHPDAAIRVAAEACELRWQDFRSSLGLDERIWRGGVRTLAASKDAVDQQAVRHALEAFEDAGVALSPARRARAKRLADRIAALAQQFSRHLREGHLQVAFTAEELAGVPDRLWQGAPRDAQGRVLLGVSDAVAFPVLRLAASGAARERMYRAKNAEGGAANLALFAEIVRLRRERARLLGAASFDELTLRRRMVGDTAHASAFLDEVRGAIRAGEAKELEELRAAKAADEGTPLASTVLRRWDVALYMERVRRERYAVDEEAFRASFPPQASLRFVMRIAERLFGIRCEPVAGTWWHPDVQAFAVVDARSGAPIGGLLVDLYPRPGKVDGAAVRALRNASMASHRLPVAVLVGNFDRRGLTLSDLETLLHEFGHALHDELSAVRWSGDAGTHVRRDFVEAPSQMLEDWVYDARVLALFREVCPDCAPVPDALLAKARVARDYGKGLRWARQHLYASFDLAVHGRDAPDPMATWRRMERATALGHVEGTMFPAGFSHIVDGGYAATYYGYLWSLAVAMDLRTAFAADRLDPAVGARYRRDVLGPGGERPPAELLRDFLGRDFSARPFFDYMRR